MNTSGIAELNNAGVKCLAAGSTGQALDLFRAALNCTMVIIEPNDPRFEPKCEMNTVAALKLSDGHVISIENAYNETTPGFFVHTVGINLEPSPCAYSEDHLLNATFASSIILFNMALAFHLTGLGGVSHDSITTLSKARSLYLKSHLLLRDAGVRFESTGNIVIDLLSMALLNNLSQTCLELQCHEEAIDHFEGLARFSATVTSSGYMNSALGTSLEQYKSNFLLNVFTLRPSKFAPAA